MYHLCCGSHILLRDLIPLFILPGLCTQTSASLLLPSLQHLRSAQISFIHNSIYGYLLKPISSPATTQPVFLFPAKLKASTTGSLQLLISISFTHCCNLAFDLHLILLTLHFSWLPLHSSFLAPLHLSRHSPGSFMDISSAHPFFSFCLI